MCVIMKKSRVSCIAQVKCKSTMFTVLMPEQLEDAMDNWFAYYNKIFA